MTRPLAVLALIALASAVPAQAQTKAATKAAPATQAAATQAPATQAQAQPRAQGNAGGRFERGVWVPEGNTLAEVLEQQDANREMAEFAARQVAENEAGIAADARARAEYEAELARVEAETRRIEAEAARKAAEYERKMAAWRAAVAACQGGDESSCGPTPEK